MLLAIFFIVFGIACFYGLTRDVGVVSFILVIGFLQDPARKLIDGEPVYMTILVGVVVACIIFRRLLINQSIFSEPFVRWSADISTPLGMYIGIVVVQGMHSLLRYGSPVITALGAIFYIAPLLAIVVGYTQFQNIAVIRMFLITFCLFAILTALSIVASFNGVESSLFGEVGEGLTIHGYGTILKAYSGLMRSSEIASWHMGTGVCFLLILVSRSKSLGITLLISTMVVLLIASIILTGRRKMILQIVIFSSLYFPILRYYQGQISNNILLIITVTSIMFWVFISLFIPSLEESRYNLYFSRGSTVFGDAGNRFTELGLGSIGWAYSTFGIFGGGLGVATQGAQHFMTGSLQTTGAGEGGLGKLVSELGIFGLLLIPWLLFVIAKHIHRCMKLLSKIAPEILYLSVGILVFIVANIPTFIVASQVYGDVFVLLILGLLSGALFAVPKQVIMYISSGYK